MNGIVFDIETRPMDLMDCQEFKPEFKPKAHLVQESAKAKDVAQQEERWEEKRGLNPLTSEVCAIGIWTPWNDCQYMTSREASEKEIIGWFLDLMTEKQHDAIIGFNSNRFDLPFICRRAWKYGLTPAIPSRGFSYDHRFKDLLEIWGAGQSWKDRDQGATLKLDALGRYFGVGEKSGSGKYFHILLDENPDEAIEYLCNDVELTRACAKVMLGDVVNLELEDDAL